MEPWLLWIRSGDRRYYRWAEVVSRHLMDVDTIHWTGTEVRPARSTGMFYPMDWNEPVLDNDLGMILTDFNKVKRLLKNSLLAKPKKESPLFLF